jgi:hypothetical protein
VPDTGSHRPSAPRPPHHRPPPLLVIAATGLAVVIGLGIALLIMRGRGGGEKDEATTAALPAPTAEPPVHPTTPPRNPPLERRGAPTSAGTTAAEAPPAEVPEWERKPLRTSQPFPEEARFDPPMPPIKIPPEMLVPPGAPDAGAR